MVSRMFTAQTRLFLLFATLATLVAVPVSSAAAADRLTKREADTYLSQRVIPRATDVIRALDPSVVWATAGTEPVTYARRLSRSATLHRLGFIYQPQSGRASGALITFVVRRDDSGALSAAIWLGAFRERERERSRATS